MRWLDASAGSFRQVIITCLLLCGLLLAYFPAAVEAKAVWWNSITYSHGWLVAFIAVWLICKASTQQRLTMSPPVWLSVITAVFGLLWFISYFSSTQFAQLLSFAGLIYLALLALFGWRSALAFVVPVGILLFAIPIWDVFTPVLKDLTITINSAWLNLAQRSALIEGDFVHVSAGTFKIIDGCAGLHFFVVGVFLAVVYAYLFLKTTLGVMLFVTITILIAMVDNWLRVFVIIMAGDLTNMQHYLVTVDHYKFGWVVFAISLLPIVLIGRFLERWEPRTPVSQSANSVLDSVPRRIGIKAEKSIRRPGRILLFAVSILGFPVYALSITAMQSSDSLDPLTLNIDSNWQPRELEDSYTIRPPHFVGPDYEYLDAFESEGSYLHVYVNKYLRQSEQAEVIGYENELFPGARSTVRTGTVFIGKDHRIAFGVFRVVAGEEERVAVVGYNVGQKVLDSRVSMKLWTGLYALVRVTTAGAIIVQMVCSEDCSTAEKDIVDFIDKNAAEMVKGIGGMRSR